MAAGKTTRDFFKEHGRYPAIMCGECGRELKTTHCPDCAKKNAEKKKIAHKTIIWIE